MKPLDSIAGSLYDEADVMALIDVFLAIAMNCDDVFEALTGSSGEMSSDVERHLARCPRCRDLQSALEPLKHGWFDDVQPSSNHPFPVHAAPSVDAARTAQESAERLQQRTQTVPSSLKRARQRLAWRYVAAFLAGAVTSLGFAAAMRSAPVTPSQDQVCRWTTRSLGTDSPDRLVLTCVACHLSTSQSEIHH